MHSHLPLRVHIFLGYIQKIYMGDGNDYHFGSQTGGRQAKSGRQLVVIFCILKVSVLKNHSVLLKSSHVTRRGFESLRTNNQLLKSSEHQSY